MRCVVSVLIGSNTTTVKSAWCKLQLVIPAKTEGALNLVDMDGAENRRSDAKMILRKIHESETKTEE